jgi:hypothetical protein
MQKKSFSKLHIFVSLLLPKDFIIYKGCTFFRIKMEHSRMNILNLNSINYITFHYQISFSLQTITKKEKVFISLDIKSSTINRRFPNNIY